MGRPRNFDSGAVMDKVVDVFWRRGYEGASIEDLVLASGLNRASLYNAFGGKKELFLAAIDRYADQVAQERNVSLAHDDPQAGIEGMFDIMLGRLSNPALPLGCLVTNCAVDAPLNTSDIGRKLSARMGDLENRLYAVLIRAQERGQLRPEADARAGARFLVSTLRGMAVMHRINGDPGFARDTAKMAMASLFKPRLSS